MALRMVFFDYGGTLADSGTNADPAQVWVEVARTLGEQLRREDVERALSAVQPWYDANIYRYLGRSSEFWSLYDSALMDHLGIARRREEFEAGVSRAFNDPARVVLFPEVLPVLDELLRQGVPMGLISNHHDRLLRDLVHLGLDRYLRTVVYSQEVGAEKPHPKVFRFALERAGCRAEEAIHVGNSFEQDYLGAHGAGLRGVWLNRAGDPPPAPCEEVADLRGLLPLVRSAP